MTAPGVATTFALLASLCIALQALTVEYGIAEVKRTTGGSSALAAAVASVVVSVVLFVGVLAVRGVGARSLPPLGLAAFVAAGLLDPFVLRLSYFEGIDRTGARISATVLGTNPALAAVLAVAVLGERLTLGLGIGIACIALGGGVLQFSAPGDADPDAERDLLLRELARLDPRSLSYPLVAMGSLALSVILVKLGLDRIPDPVLGATVGQTAALVAFGGVLLVSPGARRSVRRPPRRAYGAFALAGGFVAVALLSQFVALDAGSVVTVTPLINTFPLVVVGLSYAAAREFPRSPRALAGIVAIVVGAVLVQL